MCATLSTESARAEPSRERELLSASAGWSAGTALVVGAGALSLWANDCPGDFACLGAGMLTAGTALLAHPFVAAAGSHWAARASGSQAPYWQDLTGIAAGDVLGVLTLGLVISLLPPSSSPRRTRVLRGLLLTTLAVLSLTGLVISRMVFDEGRNADTRRQTGGLLLSF